MLSAVLLFTCGFSAAEEPYTGKTNAEIQESMATREGETLGSLADNLIMLKNLFQDEDFRNLLQIEDVQVVMNEGILRVLVWLLENRQVTMEILEVFGISAEDRACIAKIWDSAERIIAAVDAYKESENGQLLAEYSAELKNDPEILEAVENFGKMVKSEDVNSILSMLLSVTGDLSADSLEMTEGSVTSEMVGDWLDKSSFAGKLFISLMHVLEHSDWAQESVPAMMKNENVQNVVHIVSEGTDLNEVLKNEIKTLMEDPEVNDFLHRVLNAVVDLLPLLSSGGDQPAETQQPEEPQAEGQQQEEQQTEGPQSEEQQQEAQQTEEPQPEQDGNTTASEEDAP